MTCRPRAANVRAESQHSRLHWRRRLQRVVEWRTPHVRCSSEQVLQCLNCRFAQNPRKVWLTVQQWQQRRCKRHAKPPCSGDQPRLQRVPRASFGIREPSPNSLVDSPRGSLSEPSQTNSTTVPQSQDRRPSPHWRPDVRADSAGQTKRWRHQAPGGASACVPLWPHHSPEVHDREAQA